MRTLRTRSLLCCAGLLLSFGSHTRGDLLGYWPLDSTSGATATNLATGGTDGTLTGGPAWVGDPQRWRVLGFDGNDDYVDAGTIPAIGVDDHFTWSFWAYQQQGPSSDVILGNRWDAGSQTGNQWIKFTPTKFEFKTATQQINMDYVDITQNQWVHHAVVKSGNTLTYYRDGVVHGDSATVNSGTGTRPFYVGGDKFGERWQGRIDDVGIWSDALPADSIAGLEDGTYTPLTAPRYPTGSFDLADAVGGGDGRLPGVGGNGDLAAVAGSYTTYPANPYVDGTFAPNNGAGAIVIDSAGHTYDFDSQTSAGYYNPWRNGLNLDTDPSGANGLPDFHGDPDNHSLLSAHANKGITFDLAAVRSATDRYILRFTAYIGDSRPKPTGSISYYVFVDGVLATNRFGITDDEDSVSVGQVSTGRYLTIAICDANNGIASDHGYLGDPFLTLVPIPTQGTLFIVR